MPLSSPPFRFRNLWHHFACANLSRIFTHCNFQLWQVTSCSLHADTAHIALVDFSTRHFFWEVVTKRAQEDVPDTVFIQLVNLVIHTRNEWMAARDLSEELLLWCHCRHRTNGSRWSSHPITRRWISRLGSRSLPFNLFGIEVFHHLTITTSNWGQSTDWLQCLSLLADVIEN